ncbi:MAG: hypothetical protein ABIH41_06130 [Nanoarchaeota archaeon]
MELSDIVQRTIGSLKDAAASVGGTMGSRVSLAVPYVFLGLAAAGAMGVSADGAYANIPKTAQAAKPATHVSAPKPKTDDCDGCERTFKTSTVSIQDLMAVYSDSEGIQYIPLKVLKGGVMAVRADNGKALRFDMSDPSAQVSFHTDNPNDTYGVARRNADRSPIGLPGIIDDRILTSREAWANGRFMPGDNQAMFYVTGKRMKNGKLCDAAALFQVVFDEHEPSRRDTVFVSEPYEVPPQSVLEEYCAVDVTRWLHQVSLGTNVAHASEGHFTAAGSGAGINDDLHRRAGGVIRYVGADEDTRVALDASVTRLQGSSQTFISGEFADNQKTNREVAVSGQFMKVYPLKDVFVIGENVFVGLDLDGGYSSVRTAHDDGNSIDTNPDVGVLDGHVGGGVGFGRLNESYVFLAPFVGGKRISSSLDVPADVPITDASVTSKAFEYGLRVGGGVVLGPIRANALFERFAGSAEVRAQYRRGADPNRTQLPSERYDGFKAALDIGTSCVIGPYARFTFQSGDRHTADTRSDYTDTQFEAGVRLDMQ